jgi:hypothetical protein
MKGLQDEIRLLKDLNSKITTDTEPNMAATKDQNARLSAEQAQELAEARSERDDLKYKVEILEQSLDCLQNLTEEIRFKTIRETLEWAIQRHQVMTHFDKSLRQEGTVDNAVPTGEVSNLDRAGLKRKMETDLYEPNKKMRHSLDIDLSKLFKQSAAEYTRMVNTEVFRVAGRAGFINPVHFNVKKNGIVSLTDIALRNVNVAYKFKPYEEGAAFWRSEKATELSTQLRDILQWACKSTDTLLCSKFYVRLYKF